MFVPTLEDLPEEFDGVAGYPGISHRLSGKAKIEGNQPAKALEYNFRKER
jgi:hypothetical protein